MGRRDVLRPGREPQHHGDRRRPRVGGNAPGIDPRGAVGGRKPEPAVAALDRRRQRARLRRPGRQSVQEIEKDATPYIHYFISETGGLLEPHEFQAWRLLHAPPQPYTRERFEDTYAWTVSDGNGQVVASGPGTPQSATQGTLTFTPYLPGPYAVKVTVLGSDFSYGAATSSFTVIDVPPTVSVPASRARRAAR